jgi:hypothetical protein
MLDEDDPPIAIRNAAVKFFTRFEVAHRLE